MILVDINQFLIARFSIWIADPAIRQAKGTNAAPHIDLSSAAKSNFGLRCRASLRAMLDRIGRDPNEPAFLCLEGPRTWRTAIFPAYRHRRIETKAKATIPWSTLHAYIDAAVNYMSREFPALQIDEAEGDDIIGAICERFGTYLNKPNTPEIVIVSTDKDFVQLLKFWNVQIYNPDSGKWITPDSKNPARALLDHILSGDISDGIPNIRSPDDTYQSGKRSKPLLTARREAIHEASDPLSVLTDEEKEYFARNKRLIDLTCIPSHIKDAAVVAITSHLPTLKEFAQ